MNMFTITVPASSANIGPGFDSAGMAVNLYLTLEVETQDKWEFIHRSPCLPEDTNYQEHFIYLIAKQIAEKYNKSLSPCKVTVQSDIPLARGLGSSSSAVIAGIELANQLCNLSLTIEDKLQIATDIEGHPDNVAPALFGGLIVAAMPTEEKVDHIKVENLDLDLVLYIPDVELKTSDARSVLPTQLSRTEATTASGISNVMIASLIAGDYHLAGKMMEYDQFHEPYRAKLIPNYDLIKQEAKKLGSYGTVISGAGPTMISFVPKNKGQSIATEMDKQLTDYQVTVLKIDNQGLQIK